MLADATLHASGYGMHGVIDVGIEVYLEVVLEDAGITHERCWTPPCHSIRFLIIR